MQIIIKLYFFYEKVSHKLPVRLRDKGRWRKISEKMRLLMDALTWSLVSINTLRRAKLWDKSSLSYSWCPKHCHLEALYAGGCCDNFLSARVDGTRGHQTVAPGPSPSKWVSTIDDTFYQATRNESTGKIRYTIIP